MEPVREISLQEIQEAKARLSGVVLRTPLVRLNTDTGPAEVFLKLENLQSIGSFKLRGSGNAMLLAGKSALKDGVYTASAGNMAQGVAWNARRLGVFCSVIVPLNAPETKLAAIRRLGGKTIEVPFDDWWNVLVTHRFDAMQGLFIHPVSNPHVIAGNGTIGLEILEDLPDVDAVLVPFGGGGLSCGIATAVKALRPQAKVYACEVETAAPLAASLRADAPQEVEYTRTFVDGIGGKSMLTEMWPLVRKLLDGSLVVSPSEIADSVRLLLERNRILAEGAGAASVAAALSRNLEFKKVVCVISGGNIDLQKLIPILNGALPDL